LTWCKGQNTYPLPDDTIDLLEHVIRTGANIAATQADLTITRISVSTYATIPNKITQARPIQVWIQRYNGQTSPVSSTLTTTITSTSTEIVLSDVTGLPASGFIKIDNEIINYGYITQNTNAVTGTLYNCFRGQQNTIAAAHTAAATVYWQQVPAVTVWPTPDNAQTISIGVLASTPHPRRRRRCQHHGRAISASFLVWRLVCRTTSLGRFPLAHERLGFLKAQYDEAWELAAYEDHEKAALRLVPRQTYIGR
jgi:hypothetical protein